MRKLVIVVLLLSVFAGARCQTYVVPLKPSPKCTAMYVDVVIGGWKITNCLFDTGCSNARLTYSDFVLLEKLGVVGDFNYVGPYTSQSVEKRMVHSRLYRIGAMQIGGVVLRNVLVAFPADAEHECFRLIGLSVLRAFDDVRMDLRSNTLYLSVNVRDER